MKKIKSGTILLRSIKHIENSRMRDQDDVSDLMQDIEQRGLLQNIGVRLKDNALIYGNRRVKAFEKLGYTEIPCDYFDDLSDEDLMVINIVENIKRKTIGSIEIGRICVILKDKGLTNTEIAAKLCIAPNRVRSCISTFEVTKGTPFERMVVFGNKGQHRGIPETLIWQIQTSLSRCRKLSKDDWKILLRELETGKITTESIPQLRKVLLSNPTLSINEAIDILDKCSINHIWLYFDNKELNKCMKLEKCDRVNELIRIIIKKYNKDLLF